MTPIELRQKGCQALVDSLGAIDAILFLQQAGWGIGNYTAERHQWLDRLWLDRLSMNDFLAEMRKHQTANQKNNFEEIIE